MRRIILLSTLTVVETKAKISEAQEIIRICKNYIVALSMELNRKSTKVCRVYYSLWATDHPPHYSVRRLLSTSWHEVHVHNVYYSLRQRDLQKCVHIWLTASSSHHIWLIRWKRHKMRFTNWRTSKLLPPLLSGLSKWVPSQRLRLSLEE